MVKHLSPRPPPSIDAKADASAAGDSFGVNDDFEIPAKDGSIKYSDSDAAVTENVRAFIRALARQTARELALRYFASRNPK